MPDSTTSTGGRSGGRAASTPIGRTGGGSVAHVTLSPAAAPGGGSAKPDADGGRSAQSISTLTAAARSTAARSAGPLARALERLGGWVAVGVRAFWRRRGLRLSVFGLAILLIGADLGAGSAFSLPLIVIGLLTLLVGLVGQRMRGHVSLDFGPQGTTFELRTQLAPPGAASTPAVGPAKLRVVEGERRPAPAAAPGADEVIEGHGETIELDVSELRALMARADAAAGQTPRQSA